MDYTKKIENLRENIQECKVNKTTLTNRESECETELTELEKKCQDEHSLKMSDVNDAITKLEESMTNIVDEIEKELA